VCFSAAGLGPEESGSQKNCESLEKAIGSIVRAVQVKHKSKNDLGCFERRLQSGESSRSPNLVFAEPQG